MLRIVTVIAFLTLVPLTALAEEYPLDLADGGAEFLVEDGQELEIVLLHRLPGASYRVTVEKSGLVAPFDIGLVREAAPDTRTAVPDECQRWLSSLYSATSEPDLRFAIAQARTQSPSTDCTGRINTFEQLTRARVPGKFQLGEGQTLTVTVERVYPSRRDLWVFELDTGQDRRWLVHYGFSFLPDEDERFFSEEQDGGDEFVITEAADRGGADFEPTVTFTYFPRSDKRWVKRAYVPRFTAGLGADIEKRLVFAGLSWVIGDNVNLFVGAAGHEQKRLQGKYREGQVIGEALSEDQLLEDTFDVNVIAGVGFRFSGNPFQQGNGDQNGNSTGGNPPEGQGDPVTSPPPAPGQPGAEVPPSAGAATPTAGGGGQGTETPPAAGGAIPSVGQAVTGSEETPGGGPS